MYSGRTPMMEGQILMEARGVNGTLQLLKDRVRIVRGAILAPVYGRRAYVDLYLQSITAVQYKKTPGGMAGYITFHDVEGREDYEDYCVSFLKPQEAPFAAIYTAIEEVRATHAAHNTLPRLEILTGSAT